jgi:hypothetical protein
VCVCVGGGTTHLFVFHPSQPRLQSGRVAAAGRLAGAGAHRALGGRATAGIPPVSNKSKPGEMGLMLRSGPSGSIKSPARPFDPWGESRVGRWTLVHWANWAEPTGPTRSSPVGHFQPSGTFSPITARQLLTADVMLTPAPFLIN